MPDLHKLVDSVGRHLNSSAIRQDVTDSRTTQDAAGARTHKRKASDAGDRSDKGKGRQKRYRLGKLAGLPAIQSEPARVRAASSASGRSSNIGMEDVDFVAEHPARRRAECHVISFFWNCQLISTRSFLIAAQRQDRLQAPHLEGPTRKCQEVGPHAPPSAHQRSLHSRVPLARELVGTLEPFTALHAAFFAQVWCTYRTGFELIRDLPSLASLPPPLVFPGAPPGSPTHTRRRCTRRRRVTRATAATYASGVSALSAASGGTGKKRWWGLGGTKGWPSDAGWGCMLCTVQSLLATALQRMGDPPLLLSSAPSFPPRTPATHAEHAPLLSWFLDSPSAPFSVHRMALAGKAAGMWFGPSAAASALRSLVNGFPACGLGVCVTTGSTLFQSEVFAASHSPDALLCTRLVAPSRGHGASTSLHRQAHGGKADGQAKPETRAWGDRPVLLLLGIRLGLDGVNPVYHETIKMLYTFSQSVGIAGGRPSLSYYFVRAQGDGLFYLDPHHSRPAVSPRPFLDDESQFPESQTHDTLRRSLSPEVSSRGGSMSPEFERGGSMSPELVYARGSSLSPDDAHGHGYVFYFFHLM
ncbi:hypothetical protein GGX14DRAFT_626527 [Mycena pura]|uniref:Cysteine protease n=1 Tax=Mycena pura TaxID=153505 RepID=A0AAD6VHN2_9AGAR|nr:hypothetical protein GGX14DRAFT_626527 [Mycena pura]